MKIISAVFDTSAPDLKSCPSSSRPEFAFIGRSNVGKSSLINLLTERRDLAKVSVTPGKTRLINFFTINDAWNLVDLPGYGYAAVGQQRRDEFNRAVAEYLEQRRNLACVFVLVDSRHPPQAIDLQFIRWLVGVGVPFALVFTKSDKQSLARSQAGVALFHRTLAEGGVPPPASFLCSATARTGRGEILRFIAATLASHGDR
jgi:GTP-binding protein